MGQRGLGAADSDPLISDQESPCLNDEVGQGIHNTKKSRIGNRDTQM